MRILVYCDEDVSVAGGGARQVAELALGLQRLGHELHLIVPCPYEPIPSSAPYSQLTYLHVPVLRRWGLRPLTFLIMSGCVLLWNMVRWKPDVMLWFDSPGQCAPLLCHALTRCPYVLFINGFPDEEVTGLWKRRWPLKGLRTLLRLATQCAAAVLSICPEILDRAQREWGISKGQTTVIQNGVDLDMFHPRSREDARRQLGLNGSQPYIGFVGGFFPWHYLDLIVEAIPFVLRSIPEVRILFVGDGPTRGEVEQKVRAMGLQASVHFTGRVPFESVPYWISACDACVVLHKPTRSYPGNSMKLWEYLACGRPIVTSPGPGYGDLIQSIGAGLVLSSDRAEELATCLVALLRDDSLRHVMGAKGSHAMMAHTWDRRAKQLEAVLEQVVHPPMGSARSTWSQQQA